MLTREQLQAVRKIQIRTSHLVSDLFAGSYHTAFKGRGMEFAEVRPYLPGDEVRSIDWNVTARSGELHVKRFVEERELTVMLLIDASASTRFGSLKQWKNELAAELAAVLAFSAISNNDKVGLVIFSDRVELALPPRKGTRHVLRVIRDILNHEPQGKGTDLLAALHWLKRVAHRRCVVFVISDFLTGEPGKQLAVSAKRHDLVAVVVEDPRERELPALGMVALEDPESGETVMLDTSDATLRSAFTSQRDRERRERDRSLSGAGIDTIHVTTGTDYAVGLLRFFRARGRRR
jgi:uncharacterized protein (DUF58 family)